MSQMSKHYEPEFKKKIVRLHLEEEEPSKGLLPNMVYPRQVYLSGSSSSAKNAKQMKKPKLIMIT